MKTLFTIVHRKNPGLSMISRSWTLSVKSFLALGSNIPRRAILRHLKNSDLFGISSKAEQVSIGQRTVLVPDSVILIDTTIKFI